MFPFILLFRGRSPCWSLFTLGPRVAFVNCSFYWLSLSPIKYYLFSLTSCISFRLRGKSPIKKVASRFCFIYGTHEVATDVLCCSIFCMSNLLSRGGPPPESCYVRCFVRAWRGPRRTGSSLGRFLSLSQCPVLFPLASSSLMGAHTSAVKSSQWMVEWWQLV